MICGSSASTRLQRRGQMAQRLAANCASSLRRQPAAQLGERQREQEQRGELRRERLGRRDADLGAGARQERAARSARTIDARRRRCRSQACARGRATCACFSAASVSAVSPDCDTTTTSAFGLGTLSR